MRFRSSVGPQTWRRARLVIRGHVESLIVLFQPFGFHASFRIPTSPLSETGTEGHSVLGPSISRLHQQLGNLRTFPERAELLNKFFLHRVRGIQSSDPVTSALNRLTEPESFLKIADVARQAGMNVRNLERKSLLYSGVAPKALARISRFSRAFRLRSTSSLTWTQIAQEAGYHDHMHLIRDFRVFAGEAPTSAVREIAPGHLIHFCAM
jgi:AraC-like DNA-binding protein